MRFEMMEKKEIEKGEKIGVDKEKEEMELYKMI